MAGRSSIVFLGMAVFCAGLLLLAARVIASAPGWLEALLAAAFLLVTLATSFFTVAGAWYYSAPKPEKASGLARSPRVALVVPCYNEDGAMLRTTLVSLNALDYPAERLDRALLDDSTDSEAVAGAKAAAKAAGWRLIRQSTPEGGKAGALNAFLGRTDAEFLAVFDADERLTDAAFLKVGVGELEADSRAAFFQSNKQFARGSWFGNAVDAYYSFFFNFLEPVNGAHSRAMYCGSCGIVRTAALREVGGFPREAIEDVAFSLRALDAGWKGTYSSRAFALGRPVESFTGFCEQQWRYNYGNTRLTGGYIRNFWSLGLRQQFQYLTQIFGLHYLSTALVVLAVLTAAVAFSGLRDPSTSVTLPGWLAAIGLPLAVPARALVDALVVLSIAASVIAAFIIARTHTKAAFMGGWLYLLNFSCAFARIRALFAALRAGAKNPYGRGRVPGKTSVLYAVKKSWLETLLALAFFFMAGILFGRGEMLPAAYLAWYGALFSSAAAFFVVRP